MSLTDLPGVRTIRHFGGEDPLFDAFILAGPLLVIVLAVAGRSLVTEALAAAYLLAFCAYVAWRWATSEPSA